ncbi:MAG: hypothetical protein DRO15_01450 [Thermoprotei archaeon]|nr:MAG: hypothetical protein DRO15_01450 [Thermoprotei archaeon]
MENFRVGLMLILTIPIMLILMSSIITLGEAPLLWTKPIQVFDVAISADGSYVIVGTPNNITLYDKYGNVIWSYPENNSLIFTAVDISSSGNEVVGALYNPNTRNHMICFWKNAKTLSGYPEPSWISTALSDGIGNRALAISGDGNHVVAAGSGLLYWNNTKTLVGTNIVPIWNYIVDDEIDFIAVDISYNGERVIAVAHSPGSTAGYALFWDSAHQHTGFTSPTQTITRFPSGPVEFSRIVMKDCAISGDGAYFVIAYYRYTYLLIASTDAIGERSSVVEFFSTDSLPDSLWLNTTLDAEVEGVDVCGNGNVVVSIYNTVEPSFILSPYALMYFNNAKALSGDVSASWVYQNFPTDSNDLRDVEADYTGSHIIVGAYGYEKNDYVYFFNEYGELLWQYSEPGKPMGEVVDISSNGLYTVSGGPEFDSVYFFGPIIGGEFNIPNPEKNVNTPIMIIITIALLVSAIALASKVK